MAEKNTTEKTATGKHISDAPEVKPKKRRSEAPDDILEVIDTAVDAEAQGAKDAKDANDAKDTKDAKDAKDVKAEAAEAKEQALKTIKRLKEQAREDDSKLTSTLTLRTILGGDFLTAEMVRHQLWLIVLVVVFSVVYVAFRYQCQQDLIAIDRMEKELLDAKYKALSSSSTLTEKCRESHVLDALKTNKDSVLHIADQPPYIIYVEE